DQAPLRPPRPGAPPAARRQRDRRARALLRHADRVVGAGPTQPRPRPAPRGRSAGAPPGGGAPARPSLGLGRRGAFAFEAELGEAGVLGSDAGWKALRPDAWTPVARHGVSLLPVESFDARRVPAGWREPDFDDADWPAAEEIAPLSIGGGPER